MGFDLKPTGRAQRIALPTRRFRTGGAVGSRLSTVVAPSTWIVSLLTTFDNRVRLGDDNRSLVVANVFSGSATGTLRFRAESPDRRQAIETVVDVSTFDTRPITTSMRVTPIAYAASPPIGSKLATIVYDTTDVEVLGRYVPIAYPASPPIGSPLATFSES